MDTTNLQNTKQRLIDFAVTSGYSKSYIQKLKRAINDVITYGSSYESYEQLYYAMVKLRKHSIDSKWARSYGHELSSVMRFDMNGELPSRAVHHPFITKKAEDPGLSEEFSFIISNYRENAEEYLGHKHERMVSVINCGINFFQHLQKRGITRLQDASVADVMSFFYDGERAVRGKGHKIYIRALMRCIKTDLRNDALDFMDKLPFIPRKMSNYEFLTEEESEKISKAIVDKGNGLSLLDRALGAVSFFYGMRSTDITSMTMDNIDFEGDMIHLVQSKTGMPLDLPLSSVVGNAIYEYITSERPESTEKTIFVHQNAPQNSFDRIWYHIKCLCNAAGVRTEHGQTGVRLFRHHLATYLLSRKVSQPVISSILGHLLPQSINHYIDCDIENLRSFGLDISCYPVNDKVFELWQ